MDESIIFELTPEQLRNLIKLTYLSSWMVNGIRTNNERIGRFDDVEQLIYGLGVQAGMTDLIEYEKEQKRFGYRGEYKDDDEMNALRATYDDEVFWGELIQRLSTRDVFESCGPEKMANMTAREETEKRQPFLRKYIEEFENNGVKNVHISISDKA